MSGFLRDEERIVLVKHWHDSGSIEGVYGPYTQEHADWIASNFLDNATCAWSQMPLQQWEEKLSPQGAKP